MKKEIKKLFKEFGAISVSLIQRKFKLNARCAELILHEIATKKDEKVFQGETLIRIYKVYV